jgi:hypothetical protein
MEPLDDDELNQLLQRWQAPPAPHNLHERVFPPQKSWWAWLLTGSVPIPVPAIIAAAIVIALWLHFSRPASPVRVKQPGSVSLADFRPVEQLEPVLVQGGQK